MFKKIFITTFIIISYLVTCNIIYNNNIKSNNEINKYIVTDTKDKKIVYNKKNDLPIGKLIINKLNIDNNLYHINSKNNNVDKNITILKESIEPNIDNSIFYIAAHSGTGDKAYFKNLNKLKVGDKITLLYKNNYYIYKVKDIFEQDKDGYININKEKKKQLILTTCSPNHKNKQLIINSIIKEESN